MALTVVGLAALDWRLAGVVASLTSPRFSVLSGGLACVVGALAIAAAFPALTRYDKDAALAETAPA